MGAIWAHRRAAEQQAGQGRRSRRCWGLLSSRVGSQPSVLEQHEQAGAQGAAQARHTPPAGRKHLGWAAAGGRPGMCAAAGGAGAQAAPGRACRKRNANTPQPPRRCVAEKKVPRTATGRPGDSPGAGDSSQSIAGRWGGTKSGVVQHHSSQLRSAPGRARQVECGSPTHAPSTGEGRARARCARPSAAALLLPPPALPLSPA